MYSLADEFSIATIQFGTEGQSGSRVTIVQNGRTMVDDPLPIEVVLTE